MESRIIAGVILIFSLVIPVGLVNGAPAEKGDGVARVMVMPFDGAAAGNFQFLTDSIRAMISTRLAAKEQVELVDYALRVEDVRQLSGSPATPAGGESLFQRYRIDYLVSGALYELQTGLKVQVVVTGKEAGDSPLRLSVLAGSEDKILPEVELLVEEIVGKGLGIEIAGPVVVTGADGGEKGMAAFTTEHPEKVYKKGVYSGAIVPGEGNRIVVASTGVRRSSTIPSMLVTMATGDIDGDGFQEIVSASRTEVSVYRFNETRFKEIATYKFANTHKIHAVNIADMDGNGVPEIYVSGDERARASSAVFILEGKELKPLLTGVEWFLRPIVKPGGELILAGQRSSSDPQDGFVRQGVSELKVYPGFAGIHEEKRLALPRNIRLFDFEWVDLDNDGAYELVAVDQRDKLLVYDNRNSLLAVSEEDFGGSRNFFGPPRSDPHARRALVAVDDEKEFDRLMIYIPTRILAADVDSDGDKEIVVGQNNRLYGKWLANSREYDGGSVVCLDWQAGRLKELWRTNKINGYLADYNYLQNSSSLDGDTSGKAGLYVAQIPERMMFGFLMRSESKLLRYDLEITQSE